MKYLDDYEEACERTLAKLPGVNRNIKLTLVSESFFRKGAYNHNDPLWHQKYEESSMGETTTIKQILTLLQYSETREIFGLTYRDLIEMDIDTFNYVRDLITKIAQENVKRRQQAQREAKENETKVSKSK